MLAKKTIKDQITLPRKIIRDFEGTDYFDVTAQDGKIILTPVNVKPSLLGEVRENMKNLGITDDDIEDAVRWARRKKAS